MDIFERWKQYLAEQAERSSPEDRERMKEGIPDRVQWNYHTFLRDEEKLKKVILEIVLTDERSVDNFVDGLMEDVGMTLWKYSEIADMIRADYDGEHVDEDFRDALHELLKKRKRGL